MYASGLGHGHWYGTHFYIFILASSGMLASGVFFTEKNELQNYTTLCLKSLWLLGSIWGKTNLNTGSVGGADPHT